MNLFLIARNLKPSRRHILASLRGMTEVYPLLDPGTLTTFGSDSLYAAVLHTAHAAAAPRRYHTERRGAFTLYDGCPVEPKGRFAAHDAFDLDHHWEHLHETLEGSFFAARLEGETLELLSDPLGMHQTFYWQDGEQLLVSNSVRLIAEVLGLRDIDEDAVSLFLGMGYAGGDRTLVRGVRAFPGGQRWTVAEDVRRTTYFSLGELAKLPQKPLTLAATQQLADELGGMLSQLARHFGALECPITAGRDSRMMVGLVMDQNIPADFFSTGEADNPDVVFGSAIAQAFGLPHEIKGQDEDVVSVWDTASRRLLEQNDGLVTLAHIQNAVGEPTELPKLRVHLYGAGGEVARGDLLNEAFLLAPQTRSSVETHLYRAWRNKQHLLTPEVMTVVRRHIRETVGELLGQGFALRDVPDAFFLTDGVRRWAGAQFRQIGSYRDVFSPFCTRAYVRAAFSLPPVLRYTEQLPYQLLKALSPKLHALPFEKPWTAQSPARLYLEFLMEAPQTLVKKVQRRILHALPGGAPPTKAGREKERQGWLEQKLGEVRRLSLEQVSSPMWRFVDRAAFESLTAPETPAGKRRASAQNLFLALTVLHYSALLEGKLRVPTPLERAA
jgi:asparagine synthase (glutamine-hydrolysing)